MTKKIILVMFMLGLLATFGVKKGCWGPVDATKAPTTVEKG